MVERKQFKVEKEKKGRMEHHKSTKDGRGGTFLLFQGATPSRLLSQGCSSQEVDKEARLGSTREGTDLSISTRIVAG